jgi:hypothetical protein
MLQFKPTLHLIPWSVEIRFAKVITYLFHPLLVPTYAMVALFAEFSSHYFIRDIRIPLLLFGITLVSTCLLPGLSIYLLMRSGFVKSLQMDERNDRVLPYLITSGYYMLAFYMLRDFPVPAGMLALIRGFALSASTSILITAIVNLKWKISAHMVGIGGLCGAIATLVIHKPEPPFGLLYVCILIAGLVGYARLRLQAHTPAQVYSGFLLGVGCTCTLLSFL